MTYKGYIINFPDSGGKAGFGRNVTSNAQLLAHSCIVKQFRFVINRPGDSDGSLQTSPLDLRPHMDGRVPRRQRQPQRALPPGAEARLLEPRLHRHQGPVGAQAPSGHETKFPMNTETQPDLQHARRPIFYGPMRTYLFDALSHAPVMVKIPEDLPPCDMPDTPALRVTPLRFLNLLACRQLLVHNHSGDMRLSPAHVAVRKRYYWRRVCEAEGIPTDAQANGRRGGKSKGSQLDDLAAVQQDGAVCNMRVPAFGSPVGNF